MNRTMHAMVRVARCAALLGLAGCATEDLRPDYGAARELVMATTGERDVYDPEAPPLDAAEIGAVLADGLALDEAMRLALLNNRRLQADFMGLGVSRADYVQAGLLQNPSVGVSFLFPSGGGRTRVAGELAQSVTDLWNMPSRRHVAEAGMEQRVLDVSRFAGELVAATRSAYYESVAARASRLVADENAVSAWQSLAAVRERIAAGAASETEANLQEGRALTAEFQAHTAGLAEASTARQLAALLSLDGDLLDVPLTDALPAPVPALADRAQQAGDRELLVKRARMMRLDVRAMAAALGTAEARVALERDRALPDVTAGLAAERPEGGSTSDLLAGPVLSVELPIFDRNEAQISRAEFEREQIIKLYEALLADVGQEARAAADRAVLASRAAAFVDEELLPQAERSATLAQRSSDLGDATIIMLLDARRAVYQARSARIDALLEAALAVAELERVVGGPLPPEPGPGGAAP